MTTRTINGLWRGQVAHVSEDGGFVNLHLDTEDDGSNMRFTPEQAVELSDVLRAFALILSEPKAR